MRVWERIFVACFKALDVWWDTVLNDVPHIDVEEKLHYGDLYRDDDSNTLDGP